MDSTEELILQENSEKLADTKAKSGAQRKALINSSIIFILVWLSGSFISWIFLNSHLVTTAFMIAFITWIASYFVIKERVYHKYYRIYLQELTSRE